MYHRKLAEAALRPQSIISPAELCSGYMRDKAVREIAAQSRGSCRILSLASRSCILCVSAYQPFFIASSLEDFCLNLAWTVPTLYTDIQSDSKRAL
jgi:hypothetical protein